MKPRESRRKVLIKARMRREVGWCDVCIRDISSRGMLLQARAAPQRGSVIEIARGRHAIVARVVWTNGQRFGVNTQDRINVDAIIAEPDLSITDYQTEVAKDPAFERRARKRPAKNLAFAAERSRWLGQAFTFLSICLFAASLAATVFSLASHLLQVPMRNLSSALGH